MNLRRFYVKPRIPESLKNLFELAYNLWSTWDQGAFKLFNRIDPALYRSIHHNPVELIHRLSTERLAELGKDPGFLFELDQVWQNFVTYQSFKGTYRTPQGQEEAFGPQEVIAYLSMEFSLHESIPIYSGGLGILAGDYLKAASDVGLPLVGFGLLYKFGYFSQRINPDGLQEEEFRENIWFLKPVVEVKDDSGEPVHIQVPLKGDKVWVKLWKAAVGRTSLFLLDCNLELNDPKRRSITDMLYDPERDDRIEQELILGRGSRLAMRALGIEPQVFHLNEGHSAFLIVERLRELMLEKGFSFEEAAAIIRHTTVFTTHTPVIEGNEHFDQDMVADYLKGDLEEMGLALDKFLPLGQVKAQERTFWLPALAIRFSGCVNGVSRIHAQVSRRMWGPLFDKHHPLEIPIHSVTNGVHLPTWLSQEMAYLFDRYVGPDYLHQAESPEVWDSVHSIPDDELWEAHMRTKRMTIAFIRRRLAAEMERKGFARSRIKEVENVLDPKALTIGIARRFAPYKRANLILDDPERLLAILNNEDKPVQLVFSGKSHPADLEGKKIILQVLKFIYEHHVENKVVFVEDYDFDVARHLVQGVDVWLNTPLKPLEASGTSGMKAGINGVLNLSV
ncbi:MAG: alpha-glucan family phosphorylase, partial [Deltaproteobacteria bacterium]|nr:alpha-glucan family phosphorylase [Deltaproteobacteria bacterium]